MFQCGECKGHIQMRIVKEKHLLQIIDGALKYFCSDKCIQSYRGSYFESRNATRNEAQGSR